MTSSPSSKPQTTLTRPVWTGIILLGFVGSLAWGVENQYFNTFLYATITPNPEPIAWMVAASALTATLTSILMGALTDRLRTRWGRRRPVILIGYLAWGLITAAFPTAALLQPIGVAIFIAILFDCLMTFFGSSANDASFNAYVTDITTLENRGRVVGVLQILMWVSYLIVYGASGWMIESWGYFGFFYFVGGLVFVSGLIGGLLIREPQAPPVSTEPFLKSILSTFQIRSLRENRSLFLILLAMGLWGVAQQIFFPYLLIYLQHYLKIPIAQSSLLTGIAILIGGILLAYPFGLLVDRWGRKPVALASVFAEMLGLFLFSQARSFELLILTGILWLAPVSSWTISTSAWSKDLFPEDKRGQFAGYAILFTVAFSMIPGPLIGGWLASTYGIPTVLDGKPGIIPTPLIFQAAAAATLLAALPLFVIRTSKKQP